MDAQLHGSAMLALQRIVALISTLSLTLSSRTRSLSRVAQPMDFKKYLPTKESLGQTKTFRFLGNTMSNQELWHFSRHSLSYGILTGSVCAFLPIPLQMLPCIIICAWIRCNIPVALVIVWMSNPLTMPAIMYFCYRLGALLLGIAPQFDTGSWQIFLSADIVLIFEWLLAQAGHIWQPLLLGSLVAGFTLGLSGFLMVHLWYLWSERHH